MVETSILHRCLDQINDIRNFICLQNPTGQHFQKRKSESVEESPPMQEELIKEMVHHRVRYHICVQSENPVTGVHLNSHIVIVKMSQKFVLMFVKQMLQY